MQAVTRVHASAVAFGTRGVLITGLSGSGKSTLALELLCRGGQLISDDQTELYLKDGHVWARAPARIENLIEARGIGLLHAPTQPGRITAVVDLDHEEKDRLPATHKTELLGQSLPLLYKVAHPSWPAALSQYLVHGRSVPDDQG